MDTLSQLLLMLGAGMAASSSYRSADNHKEGQQTHLKVISLACTFIALAALASMTLTGTDQDSQTLNRMLSNLAVYAGLPLISSALLALARGWEWSRAAWGRWLLALFAMFELCRRSGIGEGYSEALMIAISLSWLLATLTLSQGTTRLLLAGSAVLAGVALLLFSPFTLFSSTDLPLYNLTLAAALGLLGNQLRLLNCASD